MAESQAGSTVPRRQLGRYLRDLRMAAGLSVRTAAKQLERSEPTMWRIETGQSSVRSLEVKLMCELYGAKADLTTALMALARETKAKGWWQAYGDVVPEWLDLYIGLEAAAARIDWYETELAPGLFQTEDYARALIPADRPDASGPEVDRYVQLRLERQAILRRAVDPVALRVALRESVLLCHVGSPPVMADQLAHLAKVAELPNVALRVLPFAAGFNPGMMTGPFEILRFPVNGGGLESEPPTVYADIYTGAIYLDKPHEVTRYDQAFEGIWQMSLDEEASRDLIRRAAEKLR
jgi:transcriptional regulator with XRE-family HTH domain